MTVTRFLSILWFGKSPKNLHVTGDKNSYRLTDWCSKYPKGRAICLCLWDSSWPHIRKTTPYNEADKKYVQWPIIPQQSRGRIDESEKKISPKSITWPKSLSVFSFHSIDLPKQIFQIRTSQWTSFLQSRLDDCETVFCEWFLATWFPPFWKKSTTSSPPQYHYYLFNRVCDGL